MGRERANAQATIPLTPPEELTEEQLDWATGGSAAVGGGKNHSGQSDDNGNAHIVISGPRPPL